MSNQLKEVQEDSFTMISADGLPIFVQCWSQQRDKTQSDEVLFVLHGLGEHGGRYRHLSEHLGSRFEKFYAMDQRGHGRSGGLRGHAPSFQAMLEDFKQAAIEVANLEKSKKIVLFAHSFGGLIALNSLLSIGKDLPFQAAIISAPLLGVALKVPKYKRVVGEVLARTIPTVQLTNEINPSFVSHDPKIVEAYVNDRLVHQKITPRLYFEMCKAMDWVLEQHGPVGIPTLFLAPKDDRIVDVKKTLDFYQNLDDLQKNLREYEGMYHEVVNEIGKEKVFEDIKKWNYKPN